MALKAVRGTKDIFGKDAEKFDFVLEKARDVFQRFGFGKIVTPIFEETALFNRGIGEGTDIVEKEMYTFKDKGDRSITLRPEGTASVVRAFVEHKMYKEEELNKLYYSGPMFRYERPQTGRYREFYQVGAEAIGSSSFIVDAEMIYMGYLFLKEAGIADIEVQINSVGCLECRAVYREKLKEFIKVRYEKLCDDCKMRYEKNPLRVLDCKVETCKKELADAPEILDYLDDNCRAHFEGVKEYLELFGVPYRINTKLVRGLDYYTNTVFEIVTTKLGSQGTVLAGGRYNKLISEIGEKEDYPAVGFAAGVERIMLLLGEQFNQKKNAVYIAWLGENAKKYSYGIAKQLRENGVTVFIESQERKIKSYINRALKAEATHMAVIGENEIASGEIVLKDLGKSEQNKYDINTILKILKEEAI